MMNKLRKLLSDPMAYIFLKSTKYSSFTYVFVCSLYSVFLAWLKGIEIKDMPKCNGIPYFMRCPCSRIIIGKKQTINSAFKANNIGILSRSRITTNAKGAEIIINDHVGMSAVTISAFNKIIIGEDTLIGGNVLITDSDWHPINPMYRFDDNLHIKTKPIIIGKNVFIGTRAIILKGSIIGDNSIIGAGSVVCGIIPPNVIACGNPCKVIKKI